MGCVVSTNSVFKGNTKMILTKTLDNKNLTEKINIKSNMNSEELSATSFTVLIQQKKAITHLQKLIRSYLQLKDSKRNSREMILAEETKL